MSKRGSTTVAGESSGDLGGHGSRVLGPDPLLVVHGTSRSRLPTFAGSSDQQTTTEEVMKDTTRSFLSGTICGVNAACVLTIGDEYSWGWVIAAGFAIALLRWRTE